MYLKLFAVRTQNNSHQNDEFKIPKITFDGTVESNYIQRRWVTSNKSTFFVALFWSGFSGICTLLYKFFYRLLFSFTSYIHTKIYLFPFYFGEKYQLLWSLKEKNSVQSDFGPTSL